MIIDSELDNRKIQTFEYETTAISDGKIIGTCELGKAEFQMLNDSNEYSILKGQWIKTIHGSFYIYNVEPVQEKISIKLSCYDIKYKLDTPYDSSLYTSLFPCTLKQWRDAIFTNLELIYDDSDFPNSNLILTRQPYVKDRASNRDVIKMIAEAGCSWVETDAIDKFYFRWFEEVVYQVGDWLELTTEKQNTSQINTVVLGRGDVEDNVYCPATLPENPVEFRIDNNYILDPQDIASSIDLRYTTILPIYQRVNGFSYLIFNMRTQQIDNKLSIKLGQKVSFKDIWNNNLTAYIMTKKINYLGGNQTIDDNYEITLSAEEIKESKTDYTYGSSIENDILNVSRKADKNAGSIEDLVRKVQTVEISTDEQSEKTAQLETSVTQLQTDTYTKIEVDTKLTDGSVEMVNTKTGYTFDKEGFKIDKEGEPTKAKYDNAGQKIVDKSGSTEKILSYNGYITNEIAQEEEALERYEGQSVNYNNNIVFNEYLSSNNGRWEDVEDETYGKGIGFFIY